MAYPTIRDPFTSEKAIFFSGFYQGSFTWVAFPMLKPTEGRLNFKSDKRWPGLNWLRGTLADLEAGIIVDENLIATTGLEKALEMWATITKRRKDRADRAFNQVTIVERALAARDKTGLMACMAEAGV